MTFQPFLVCLAPETPRMSVAYDSLDRLADWRMRFRKEEIANRAPLPQILSRKKFAHY